MTDLEMTKLCAEAVEPKWTGVGSSNIWRYVSGWSQGDRREERYVRSTYDPLHDDAQAMALVKKLRLTVGAWPESFHVIGKGADTWNDDLNRAIVECVVKMQAAKRA